jgi:DNA topoisomerase I
MNQTITEIDKIAAEAKRATGLVYVPGLETDITRKVGAKGSLPKSPD